MFLIDFHQFFYIGGNLFTDEQFIQFVDAVFNFLNTIFNPFNLILAFSFFCLFFFLTQIIVFSGGFRRKAVRAGFARAES